MEFVRIFNKKRLGVILLLWLICCIWFYRLNAVTEDETIMTCRNEQIEYIHQYQSRIQSIIDHSESLLELNLLQNSAPFVKNNLLKTRYDFIDMKNINVKEMDCFGFVKAYQYNLMLFFSIISAFIVISSFFEEKKGNLFLIIHASKNGRGRLAVKRFTILALTGIVVTVLYESSIYAIGIGMFQNNFDFLAPVQSVPEFSQCILHINFIQMVLVNIFVDSLIVLCFSMIFWLLTETIRSKNIIVLCYAICIGIEAVLYNVIRAQSVFKFFKYCNLIAVFDLKKHLFSYSNFGVFNWITETSDIIIAFCVMIILCILLKLVMFYKKSDINRYHIKIFSVFRDFLTKWMDRIFVRLPLVFMEVYKQMNMQRGKYVLLIAIFILLYSRLSVGVSHNEIQAGLDFYYKEVIQEENQEEYTSEYINHINQWLMDADIERAEYEESKNIYRLELLNKEIRTQSQIRDEIIQQQQYRSRQAEKRIKCGIIPQQEYQSITGERMDSFEENNALISLIAIIVATYGLISFEKKSNMICLIKSAAIGYKKYLVTKMLALFLITFLFWLILYGLNFINLVHVYHLNLGDFKYPVQSIMTLSSYPLHISIGVFFILKNMKRLMIMLLIALFGFWISIKTTHKNGILICALFFLPYILDGIGIPIMKYLSAVYWMKVC